MIVGPDTKYMMQWGGEWRAVTHMLDVNNMPTTLAMRAAKVVLFVSESEWIATAVYPGEIVERTDREPGRRPWDYVGGP
jgi:hypothetical protein